VKQRGRKTINIIFFSTKKNSGMKTTSVFVAILLFYSINLFSQTTGVQFIDNLTWNDLKQKAKTEKKNIFIDVYATWCGPCKDMDAKVYPKEEVGQFINDKFISVKVQQDKSEKDNAFIKSWYADAASIIKEYHVEAFPTYLFVSPEGKLMHKEIGFKEAPEFMQTVELALSNPIGKYDPLLAAYQQGKRDYQHLDELILHIFKARKNNELAFEMARDYKKNYLDKLKEPELLTRRHLDFIGEFFPLISIKDKFFKLCYEQPVVVNKAKGWERTDLSWANFQVIQTIEREELEPRLYKDIAKGIPVKSIPEWKNIQAEIEKKYPRLNKELYTVGKLIEEAKKKFYKKTDNGREAVKIIEEKMRNDSAAGKRISSWDLNVLAWEMFTDYSDKYALNKGLQWADSALKMEEEDAKKKGVVPNSQIYDTKANLLYRLGRVKEAIEWEEKALELDLQDAKKAGREKGWFSDSYIEIIEKMRKGKPTWPEKK
jgi:thioredoxin-related protein